MLNYLDQEIHISQQLLNEINTKIEEIQRLKEQNLETLDEINVLRIKALTNLKKTVENSRSNSPSVHLTCSKKMYILFFSR